MLEEPSEIALVVFISTITALLWVTLISLFIFLCPEKATYISNPINLTITIIINKMPYNLEKLKPSLISVYQDLCIILTSGTLIWILMYWCLMLSTEGSFQLRFRNSVLLQVVTILVVHFIKVIHWGWLEIVNILVDFWIKTTNSSNEVHTSNAFPQSTNATQA